ncbi:hypothetical protein M427DRAFT_30298 [Gonapodya prolifera JEL478]|uniref:Glyoxalase-like domain-containing protein n=1 Tax=Gonapodya prolifera (strain JEL478) TaxID=1344416 RepID=A0A139AL11_GONPJ|nr:hypothetical protein M427DRAFT_30298 [Gonapodya prolifera JEL478]|eukprot:KXS17467.1 hypothetical protein M427DRAFT_30298 [Gonapodya prolifera JEL478]
MSDTERAPSPSSKSQPSGRNRQPRETPVMPPRVDAPASPTAQTNNQALSQPIQKQTAMVAPGVNQGMPTVDPGQLQTSLPAVQPAAPRGKGNTLKLRLDINLEVDVQLKARVHGDITLSLFLAIVTIICNDIPQALSFYVGQLGFVVKQADTERDRAAVGNQGGDSVLMQIETDDWNTLYEKLKTMGAAFVGEHPRDEGDYRAATIRDPMGNLVCVIEKTTTTLGRVFAKDIGF